jgi:hypothetical protein
LSGIHQQLDLPSLQASCPRPEDGIEFDAEDWMTDGDRRSVGKHPLVERPRTRMVCVALIDDRRKEAAVYDNNVR